MAISQTLKLKLALTETPVINGFSYAFLRLLVNRLRKVQDDDMLFTTAVGSASLLDGEMTAVFNYICDQLKIMSPMAPDGYVEMIQVTRILESAEEFLTIFELTDDELVQVSRTPERP